ncbi:MAG: Unknown protein [uncultured Sulfurovum sp.]|uniref:Periplasmic protein n=1 Tax=uncultured Sulfurovum sp. TaxID=269237 RepID=A0A6S6SZG2_9BACT|nr:MAG: Unknown protein [uncultured Sulfurovum sp.]
MKKILLILLILLTSIFFLIFNDKGNEYLKPYVATYLEKKLDNNMSVEVKHLKVDLSYVELTAVLNKLTEVEAKGDFSLLAKTFDMDYKVTSDGFKNEQISFDNKIAINGTVVGNLKDMKIQGEGETLKSHIDYALNIKNDSINNIKVKINKADIASLLQLASQPAYAKGKVDIDINIPTFEEENTKGDAKIVLHKTTLDEKVFKEVLQIDLAPKTILTADLNSKVTEDTFELNGNIKSNLAWLKLSKTIYNTKTKKLSTDYRLLVPELSKLMFLTKQKLMGQLQVNGIANLKKDHIYVEGKSRDLGGETSFDYNGKKLNANLDKIDIAKLLYMINQRPYATGTLLANVKIDDFKKLRGTYDLQTKEAKTINSTLKSELDLDFQKDTPFSLESKGDIASNFANIEHKLYSEIFQYRSSDMIYNLSTKKLTSTYILDIPKLSKLNGLAGKPLNGEVKINGEINYDKTLEVIGSSKSLGGNINFKLAEKILSSKIDNVPVERLMKVLSYPLVFKATLVGDFYYDVGSRQGSLTSTLNKAQLLENQLTVLVKQIRGIDLTKERYNETHFNATLNKNLIDIDFQAKSKKTLFAIPSGHINKSNNSIDANYKIDIENKDIGGKIKGNISKPKVTIESSNYLKEKVVDVIKNNISEDTLKQLGLDKIEPKAIKNLLGDLFK